jgi:hypothetical protein
MVMEIPGFGKMEFSKMSARVQMDSYAVKHSASDHNSTNEILQFSYSRKTSKAK